jgi:arylsulfatase A-like enzyme
MIFHGNSLYPEQVHVPLLIRLPGAGRGGSEVDGPVSLTWIPATVGAVTGHAPGFPGGSLLNPDSGSAALAEVGFRPQVPRAWPTAHGWLKTLITERWQYTRQQDGRVELFDRQADPGSDHDLSKEPTLTPVVTELQSRLDPFLPAALAAGRP